MARLEQLESAFVHVTDVLVLQGERIDAGLGGVRNEMQSMRNEMQSMREETRGVRDETRTMREVLTERLDRLIAITTRERTSGIERLANIEQRLARLEERAGIRD
jgi:hypothetical protein